MPRSLKATGKIISKRILKHINTGIHYYPKTGFWKEIKKTTSGKWEKQVLVDPAQKYILTLGMTRKEKRKMAPNWLTRTTRMLWKYGTWFLFNLTEEPMVSWKPSLQNT